MHPSKTRINIADVLNSIFKESIDAVKKKSKRLVEADESDPFDTKAGGEESEKDSEASDEDESKKIANKEDSEKLKAGNITAEDVVEKLNAIRSGKSYKDEEIMGKLTEYVKNLSDAEKTALLAFLKALSQIVTGEVASKDVVKPSDKPVDVKMEKQSDEKKVTIKPTIIKKQSPEEDKIEKTPAEDTKGPVPIVAKKK